MITEQQQSDIWFYDNFDGHLLRKQYFPNEENVLNEEQIIYIWKKETGLSGNLYTEDEIIQLLNNFVYDTQIENFTKTFGTLSFNEYIRNWFTKFKNEL